MRVNLRGRIILVGVSNKVVGENRIPWAFLSFGFIKESSRILGTF